MADAPIQVELLDGFRVQAGRDEPELPFNAQRLVAHLGLSMRPNRSAVAGVLWPEVSERHAQGSLRSTLWRLEQCCPGLVQSAAGALFLAPSTGVDVRELVDWARRILDPAGQLDATRAPEVAFRGELLPGWYYDWVLVEREYLHQLRMHALEALAHKLARSGRFGESLEAAHSALRCEPLRESAHRLIIRIHLAEGNTAEALRHYDRFASSLKAELGVHPTDRLTQMLAHLRPTRRPRSLAKN